MTKYLSVALFILSIICLIPGLTEPLITIEASVDKQNMVALAAQAIAPPQQTDNFLQNMLRSVVAQLQVQGSVLVFSSTRSLLGTMHELIAHGHQFVGILIGLFGVVIPVIKIMLTTLSVFLPAQKSKAALLNISSILGKWSMSDVFVMALMVAFLAINANEDSINTVQMSAELDRGFYFFAAYCLLAIAAGQLMQRCEARKRKVDAI
ncbi:MAG: paraquat-inducible protein A [Pseudomonadales bacterium]|nr:paraquat-inducible protein A [Pseudomonadales bacterium]